MAVETNADIIALTNSKVAAMEIEAAQAASDLEAIADDVTREWIEFDSSYLSLNAIDNITVPANAPTLTLPSFDINVEDYFTDDAKKHVYESEFFAFLEPKLIEFITEESTGISEEVQDALFDNMREHDLQVLNDSLDAVDRTFSTKAFPIPTNVLTAARNEVIAKYDDIAFNRNREITALIAERAQQNVHHAVDAGIKMEDIQSRFTLEYARLGLLYVQAAIEEYKATIQGRVAEYEGQLKLVELEVNTANANAQLDAEQQRNLINKWLGTIQNATDQTKALIQQDIERSKMRIAAADQILSYYRTAVAGYTNQVNAVSVASESS